MNPFPIPSPSGLLEFESCPKKWNLTKVRKLHKFEVTEAITHGNVVHEQLERYVKYKEPLPEHLEYTIPFFENLREQGVTLYAELECAIKPDWTPTDWWDKGCYLRGKVDLIGIKDDEAVVFDYKTGKRKPDPTQLKIYGAMLYHVLGLKKVRSYYMWLQTKEQDHFVITEDNIGEVTDEITTRISRMREAYDNKLFPARTSPLCGWCPALDTCEEAVYYKNKKAYRK